MIGGGGGVHTSEHEGEEFMKHWRKWIQLKTRSKI